MNKGTEYEKLIQEIYQDLLKKDELTTEVQHNVKIQGKATKHQIDIYWEYKIAGVHHKVAIECKNYNKKSTYNNQNFRGGNSVWYAKIY